MIFIQSMLWRRAKRRLRSRCYPTEVKSAELLRSIHRQLRIWRRTMTKNLGYSLPDPGDFEVVHIAGLGGSLIHLGEMLNGSGFADYEHARLYLGDGRCVQAEPGGATIVPFDPNDHGRWSTGLFSIPPETRKK